jgi:hypothetical protein
VKEVKALSAGINDFVAPRLEQGLDGLQDFKEGDMGRLLKNVIWLAVVMEDVERWEVNYKGKDIVVYVNFQLSSLFSFSTWIILKFETKILIY